MILKEVLFRSSIQVEKSRKGKDNAFKNRRGMNAECNERITCLPRHSLSLSLADMTLSMDRFSIYLGRQVEIVEKHGSISKLLCLWNTTKTLFDDWTFLSPPLPK